MQPVSGHQRADRWRCLSYCACHATCIFADLLHSCHRFCNCHKTLTFGSLLARCKIHCACPGKWWFKRPKVVRTRCAFIYIYIYIIFTISLWSVLRATAACTFWTAQLPKVVKWFLAFWLRDVLRATEACAFSTAQLPRVLGTWNAFNI